MFRPARVFHTIVILPENKVDDVINHLFELGLCELKNSELDLCSKYSYDVVKKLDDMQTRFSFVLDSIDKYKKTTRAERKIKSILFPEPIKKHKSLIYSADELIDEVEYHLSVVEPKVTEKLNMLVKIQEEIEQNQFIISNLKLIPNIETYYFEPSEIIKTHIGILSKSSLEKIKEKIGDRAIICFEEQHKNLCFVIVFSSYRDYNIVDRCLHEFGFEVLDIPYEKKKPSDIIRELETRIDKLNTKKMRIESFLEKLERIYGKKLAILKEELDIAKEKLLALNYFKTTKAFSVFEAWVPEKDLNKFHKVIKETSRYYYIEISERDDAPTLFKNPKLVKPFEMITELYGPPKYKKLDPTPILAVTFTIFFGFMLTDVAYGLLLILVAILLYKGIGRINTTMKNFSVILMFFGVSTILIGAIFGSYFGNFFQEIGLKLPVPIDAMRQAMLTLSIALGLGSLHLIIGLVTGLYENFKDRNIRDGLAKQGVWLAFMLSLFLFLFKLNGIGLVFLALAIIMQLFFNYLDGGVVSSFLSIFGFSGFLGDLFSYARLMALGIGTSGIALAVNFMVFMVIDLIPVVGLPIGIVIFIFGHIFNMAMNGLGAFVHSTRLHFLEFFTKFYEGGGKTYKPFLAEREYTLVK